MNETNDKIVREPDYAETTSMIPKNLGDANPNTSEMDETKKQTVLRNQPEIQIGGYSSDLYTEEDKEAYKAFLAKTPFSEDLDAFFLKYKHDTDKSEKDDNEHLVDLTPEEIEFTFPPAPSCEDELVESECKALLRRFIETELTAGQARRLNKYYYEGMTQQAIADEENTTRQVVTKSIELAIRRLKKAFRRAGYNVPNI